MIGRQHLKKSSTYPEAPVVEGQTEPLQMRCHTTVTAPMVEAHDLKNTPAYTVATHVVEGQTWAIQIQCHTTVGVLMLEWHELT